MFCTTLRRRPSYASAIPSLISTEGLKLRENQLDTHDLEIPTNTSPNTATDNINTTSQLRVLLLSQSSTTDNNLPNTFNRIHHFAALTGGQNLAIIFLLRPPQASTFISAKTLTSNETTQETEINGVLAYSKLQASLVPRTDIHHIPILPLASIEGLPQLLKEYSSALVHKPKRTASAASPFELLQLCTTEPPMDRQTAYFATDCFANLRELAATCTEPALSKGSSSPASQSGFGRGQGLHAGHTTMNANAQSKLEQLRALVGEERCREMAEFWVEEWVVD